MLRGQTERLLRVHDALTADVVALDREVKGEVKRASQSANRANRHEFTLRRLEIVSLKYALLQTAELHDHLVSVDASVSE